MNQIAIGDSGAGYTVLDGASIAAPNFKATVNFAFSPEAFVKENIEIEVKGTISQINTFLSTLELIIQRARLYSVGKYSAPQQLRFQRESGGDYYYTPISSVYLGSNPAGYLHHGQGSKVIILHYTRPNHFDGPKAELILSGRNGTGVTGGYTIYNHTDLGIGHGSSVFVAKTNFTTQLPAPLRLEYYFTTGGAVYFKDFFIGLYSHATYYDDDPFFALYNMFTGGVATANAGAIQGYYRAYNWTSATWSQLGLYLIDTAYVLYFSGYTFRPVLHFFNTHAYTDLYFRVTVERSGDVLYTSEPVHSPPAYGYLFLPPIEIPPNYLLNETSPARIQVGINAWKLDGAAAAVNIDAITLFPLNYSASFYGINNSGYLETLIDDSSRDRHNVLVSGGLGESVRHARVGGPLLLMPNEHNRFFVYITDNNNTMPIAHTGELTLYYYPRLRLL